MIMDIVPNKSVSSHQTQLYQKMLFFFPLSLNRKETQFNISIISS